jgi:hypothetical protein
MDIVIVDVTEAGTMFQDLRPRHRARIEDDFRRTFRRKTGSRRYRCSQHIPSPLNDMKKVF